MWVRVVSGHDFQSCRTGAAKSWGFSPCKKSKDKEDRGLDSQAIRCLQRGFLTRLTSGHELFLGKLSPQPALLGLLGGQGIVVVGDCSIYPPESLPREHGSALLLSFRCRTCHSCRHTPCCPHGPIIIAHTIGVAPRAPVPGHRGMSGSTRFAVANPPR